ncbi:hypothetical protein GJV85_03570 [Sulfurimonas aquatica]|uniref:4Fe4S-binding SPASM domain-containing protein n=1 Tax=Sulfurimonas aquatica TaxID=2672570 RepID=A0A975GCF8_9BACT|nr:SPASM domain-containing protein [Sulfurimonas aquatica]QSZ41229.1 hypothetical protein GJV85_03570 [Sulfurimonas aquatica]
MKYCSRPWTHMYVGPDGVVKNCSWIKFPEGNLGNLVDSSVEELWNGDMIKNIRDSIEDGSYKYCDEESCPLLGNDSLPDLSSEELKNAVKKDSLNNFPIEFNMAYDYVCNHACPTCRDTVFKSDKVYTNKIDKIENELLPYLDNAILIMASGNGDLFSSKSMLNMLGAAQPKNKDCVILLETNGALIESKWDKIKHLEDYQIHAVVTPNSYEEETYTLLTGGIASYQTTMDSLKFLAKLRLENKVSKIKLNMVVQDTNFREIPSFVDRSINEFNADIVQLKPVLRWWRLSEDDADYNRRNVRSPLHPSHKEFIDVINDPICKNPKVYHWNGENFEN